MGECGWGEERKQKNLFVIIKNYGKNKMLKYKEIKCFSDES